MTVKQYQTPLAFKNALEQRLRAQVQSGRSIERLRQLLVFDRFLARLIREFEDAMVLKGGLALELRLARPRTTKDIDIRFSGDPNTLLERLQRAARLDLSDFLGFEVTRDRKHPTITGEGTIYHGQRYVVAASLAGKPYGKESFGLDVGIGDPMISDPEEVLAADHLGFIGVAPPRLRIYPLETHLAEKLHAYTQPRETPNSRSKDLYDIALVSLSERVGSQRLFDAIQQTFTARSTHPIPKEFPPPPTAWFSSYEQDRIDFEFPWATLALCHRRATDFMAPVLADVEACTWNPDSSSWAPDDR